MNYNPLISVLTPAYNASLFIRDCVESVLAQSYQNFEFIICDDCSSDSTREILLDYAAKDSRIRILQNNHNKGYLDTFNFLLTQASGKLISFIDADDIISPDKLLLQYQFLCENPDIALVGCNNFSIKQNGAIVDKTNYKLSHNEILHEYYLSNKLPICGSSVMVRDFVIHEIGGYRPYFKNCVGEDIDWILRISDLYKIANISFLGYSYRFNNSSLTRRVHFSIKQRHIFDIIRFLADQRISTGSDLLQSNNVDKLQLYIKSLNLKYYSDSSSFYKMICVEYAINKNKTMAYMYLNRFLKLSKSTYSKLKIMFIVNMLLYVNYDVLLSAKKILKLNHISRNV